MFALNDLPTLFRLLSRRSYEVYSCNLFGMTRAGFEPATRGLKVRYSTRWVIESKFKSRKNQQKTTFDRVCTLRRMWDSNPRVTSLPPSGFQDRPLEPDLGNPPQNQSLSVFSLGRWSSQIPMAIYNRIVLRTIPSTPTSKLLVWAQVCLLCAKILRFFANMLLNFFLSFAV